MVYTGVEDNRRALRVLGGGVRPMLLWYVWIRLAGGAWHKLDDIAKQLRIPKNAISWAAGYLCEHNLAEEGEEDLIRLHHSHPRFEEVVKSLPQLSKVHLGTT